MTLDAFLAQAASEIGTVESPPGSNRTKYGAWAVANGHPMGQGVSWCDIFVSYCAARVGLSAVIPYSAYVPTRLAGAQGDRTADRRPERGALACFDWNNDGNPDHIGIVEAVNPDGSLTTIEGNTSPGDGGSQSNGGGVYRRRRPVRYVTAFIHPPYQEADVPLSTDDLNAIIGAVWGAEWTEQDANGKTIRVNAGTRLARAAGAPTATDIAHAVLALLPPASAGGLTADQIRQAAHDGVVSALRTVT